MNLKNEEITDIKNTDLINKPRNTDKMIFHTHKGGPEHELYM